MPPWPFVVRTSRLKLAAPRSRKEDSPACAGLSRESGVRQGSQKAMVCWALSTHVSGPLTPRGTPAPRRIHARDSASWSSRHRSRINRSAWSTASCVASSSRPRRRRSRSFEKEWR